MCWSRVNNNEDPYSWDILQSNCLSKFEELTWGIGKNANASQQE